MTMDKNPNSQRRVDFILPPIKITLYPLNPKLALARSSGLHGFI